ncbi:hypothetical protein B0A50_08368 [Salinomyces thailandicus]|uniref:Uncharacterized protein n=1 Tax=Salinomyces thailandicus TaxID=706561 RepID=A0A4U0TJX1_9PEZI|nr:hypothetical protein B0A50_08368 [Salinomyces thailandica]
MGPGRWTVRERESFARHRRRRRRSCREGVWDCRGVGTGSRSTGKEGKLAAADANAMTIDRPKGMRDKGLLSYAAANQCNRPSTSPVQYGAALYTVQLGVLLLEEV